MMFSIPMIASSTNTPSATANPPRVMVFRVSPMRESTAIAASSDSGIAVKAMTRGAPVAQERIQHGDDQDGRDQQRALQLAERFLDEIRRADASAR